MKRALSPARSPNESDDWNWLIWARSSWMRLEIFLGTPTQTLACTAGKGDRTAWRKKNDSGGCSADRGHQPRPRQDDQDRRVSQRSLLSSESLPHYHPAATFKDIGYSTARPLLRQQAREAHEQAHSRDSGANHVSPGCLVVARQCKGVGELY